jgi:hypothetical protein
MTSKSIRERINDEDWLETAKKTSIAESKGIKNTRSCYLCAAYHSLPDGVISSLFGRDVFFCSQECKDKILRPMATKVARIKSS